MYKGSPTARGKVVMCTENTRVMADSSGSIASRVRRSVWQKKHGVKASAKPRHVLRQIRDGTPAQRADANRRRDSRNANYGTGSTAAGAAAAC